MPAVNQPMHRKTLKMKEQQLGTNSQPSEGRTKQCLGHRRCWKDASLLWHEELFCLERPASLGPRGLGQWRSPNKPGGGAELGAASATSSLCYLDSPELSGASMSSRGVTQALSVLIVRAFYTSLGKPIGPCFQDTHCRYFNPTSDI